MTRASDHLGSSKGNVVDSCCSLRRFREEHVVVVVVVVPYHLGDSFPPFTFSQVWNSLQGLLCT